MNSQPLDRFPQGAHDAATRSRPLGKAARSTSSRTAVPTFLLKEKLRSLYHLDDSREALEAWLA